MNYRFVRWLMASFLLLALAACGDSSDTEQSNIIKEIETLDSVYLADEPTSMEEAPLVRPELIGNWKLVDMRIGGKSYLDNVGNTSLELLENGSLIYTVDDLPPKKGDFAQAGDFLSAPDIWDEDLSIKKVSETQLVLADEVSGEKVEYHYEKSE